MAEHEDDTTAELIAEHLRATDPVPESVIEMAKSIPSMSRLDAELAELVEPVGATRGDEHVLHFQAGDVVITAEHANDGLVVAVFGLDATSVVLEAATGTQEVLVERAGLWAIDTPRPGPSRIIVTHGRLQTATSWFTLGE